ncbi:MAG: hypothetical protein ACHQLQ_01890 [Candidatus Acidiferrales bacterium]
MDPLSLIISMGAADAYYCARQYDQAIAHLRGILELESRFVDLLRAARLAA